MPQSERSVISFAVEDLLSVVPADVPAASLREMMKVLDQTHGDSLTIDVGCSVLVELALMALQLHGKLKLVQGTLVTGNVSSAVDDGETFYRGRATYYKRELTDAELGEIGDIRAVGWKKAVRQLILDASNRPQTGEAIKQLLVGETYKEMNQLVLGMFNSTVFGGRRNLAYRLAFVEGGNPHQGPFRFYRFKQA